METNEKNKLMLPLKKELMLIVDGSIYIGTIVHAGTDVVKICDLRKRNILDHGFEDIYIAQEFFIDRNKIHGYCRFDNEQFIYSDNKNRNTCQNMENVILFGRQ